MTTFSAKIFVSNAHVHLSKQHTELLFGTDGLEDAGGIGHPSFNKSACFVSLETPKGKIENVRVLIPCTKETWVEISRTQAFRLGIKPPITKGDLPEGQLVVRGPRGAVELKRNVVIENRHLRISAKDAQTNGITENSVGTAEVSGPKSLIFKNVTVRIEENPQMGFETSLELDRDEANACMANTGDLAQLHFS